MEHYQLIKNEKDHAFSMETRILTSPESLSVLQNPLRMKILEELAKKPQYPAALAKTLKIHEQKIYYHIKQLLNAGFLEEIERKEIRGTVAKRYKPSALAFTVVLQPQWKQPKQQAISQDPAALWFFAPFFNEEQQFRGSIVVGSPDPHGKYKAYARDGHYGIELSLYLGNLGKIPPYFTVLLDVDVKKEQKYNQPLIVIGGPVTNTLVEEINDQLPVQFTSNPVGLYSKKTGKRYVNDTIGVIEMIKNPFAKDSWMLILAGIRAIGTKSTIIALTKDQSPIRKAYLAKKRPFSMVVEGFDLDSDGKIETIEILE